MPELAGYSDEDFKQTMLRALRVEAIVTLVAMPLVWWKMGWQSAAFLAIGALISGSGLWEWLRLMTVVMARMDGGGKPAAMGAVLTGFFLRLGLAFGVAYGSLKFLDGSVYALAVGLGLGVFALSFEGLRLVKTWTV